MTKEEVLTFLETQFALSPDTVTNEVGLFSEGYLDSFSIVDLIMFLETKAGIKVDPVEVNLDNLDSIDKILAYVASKQ
jgi:acyl carrier protein